MSSSSRGLAPPEVLGCLVDEDGPYSLLASPRRGPQVGKFGDPHSQDADSYVKRIRWCRIDNFGGPKFDFWFGTYVDMRKWLRAFGAYH